ncbi:hypothetical protein, partial [Agrobacterium tumefaciens]|uniref:hypothetical protein n=1 Tax=Agrobacterium tumefaciens TaxID=358 RepID=UPI001AEC3C9D
GRKDQRFGLIGRSGALMKSEGPPPCGPFLLSPVVKLAPNLAKPDFAFGADCALLIKSYN